MGMEAAATPLLVPGLVKATSDKVTLRLLPGPDFLLVLDPIKQQS